MPFSDILGHDRQIRILQAMLASGNVPHAFLFTGIAGIGKRLAAAGLVKALNCLNETGDFCGACLQCGKIDRALHPDVLVLEPEKNVLKIEQVRSMQQEIVFKPLEGRKKAVIIDQADKLNAAAANCLLKTLEEPPENTVLVLVAQAVADMLPTVLSRCQRIHFSPLADGDIARLLADRGIGGETARQILPLAQGSLQRALMLAGSDFLGRRAKLAQQLSEGRSAALKTAEDLAKSEELLEPSLEFLEAWLRDVLVLQEAGPEAARLYNGDLAELAARAAAATSRETVCEQLRRLRRLRTGAALNPDMQLGLEAVLLL